MSLLLCTTVATVSHRSSMHTQTFFLRMNNFAISLGF